MQQGMIEMYAHIRTIASLDWNMPAAYKTESDACNMVVYPCHMMHACNQKCILFYVLSRCSLFNWFLSCVAVVVQSCCHAKAILHALLSLVGDMSQALGKTIDISAWRVRYLSCQQFVLQCIPTVVMHTMPCVLDASMHLLATWGAGRSP